MNASLRAADESGRLEFSRGKLHGERFFTCTATIETDGAEWPAVELEMIEPYRADMLGFFEQVGRRARAGWRGENVWRSEFGQLELSASSDGTGLVTFAIQVRWRPTYDEERTGVLICPAEAVERFADRMRHFLRLERGHRFRRVS